MILCLNCYALSPAGSAFCQQCGRSFGGRLCNSKKRHHNHPAAQVCTQCGSHDLTTYTPRLPLGCVTRLLSWAVLLLVIHLLFNWVWPTVHARSAGLIHIIYCRLVCAAISLIDSGVYWMVFLVVSRLFIGLLPTEVSQPLEQLLSSLPKWLTKAVIILWRLAWGLVRGTVALLGLMLGQRHELKP